MSEAQGLSDHDHQRVIDTADELTQGRESALDKVGALFHFVRDRIRFGFPTTWSEWNRVTASRVLESGFGYCNTKATLMVALCRACGVPARVHYGLIDARIMRGIFPSFSFPFLPKSGPHSWTEVDLGGEWRPIDSYINDEALFRGARARLERSGRTVGYSLACFDGKCSCEFNFGEKGFVHMGAVVEDHGCWEDASDYYESDKYIEFNSLQRLFYPVIAVMSNSNIERVREAAS